MTILEPLLATTAISLVGSFTGSTSSTCLVKRILPSRKGGLVSCTISRTRQSESKSASRRSFALTTPLVISLLFSHALRSDWISLARFDWARVIVEPSLRFRCCCISSLFRCSMASSAL